MERLEQIWRHPLYQDCLMKNRAAEADRRFCRHNMEHFLDVARIGWIMVLEEGLAVSKELLYAAALLHDIGRFRQYEEKIPHEVAGVELASRILCDCAFTQDEQREILDAISGHRSNTGHPQTLLGEVLCRADKASRPCFSCGAAEDCNWVMEKRNLKIRY